MNCKEIIKSIMVEQNKTLSDVADAMGIKSTALWDRLKTKKSINGKEVKTLNITVAKLNDILRVLGYKIVIVPRDTAKSIKCGYVVEDTDGIRMSDVIGSTYQGGNQNDRERCSSQSNGNERVEST